MLVDDGITDAEAQAGARTRFLGGEEGVEDLFQKLGFDPPAVVGKDDHNAVVQGGGADPDASFFFDGLNRVEQNIEKDLGDLAFMAKDRVNRRKFLDECDLFTGDDIQQSQRHFQLIVDIDEFSGGDSGPGKGHQIGQERGDPKDPGIDMLKEFGDSRFGGILRPGGRSPPATRLQVFDGLSQRVKGTLDQYQGVVDFVGKTGRQETETRHLLRVNELHLGRLELDHGLFEIGVDPLQFLGSFLYLLFQMVFQGLDGLEGILQLAQHGVEGMVERIDVVGLAVPRRQFASQT